MTHHHHEPGHAHPAALLSPSLLRMSIWQRLAAAIALSAVLWLAVAWAVH
jgi:hypothetical protein